MGTMVSLYIVHLVPLFVKCLCHQHCNISAIISSYISLELFSIFSSDFTQKLELLTVLFFMLHLFFPSFTKMHFVSFDLYLSLLILSFAVCGLISNKYSGIFMLNNLVNFQSIHLNVYALQYFVVTLHFHMFCTYLLLCPL